MKLNSRDILNKIFSYLLKGIVLILPLFFLPVSIAQASIDNCNKMYLIWLVVSVLVLVYFLITYQKNEIVFKKTVLDKFLLAYFFICLLSAIFSIDKFSSWFGFYSSLTEPLLLTISLIIFYYLVINFIDNKNNISSLIKPLLLSYSIIVVIATLLVFGYFSSFEIIPKYFRLATGGVEDLAVFLSIINILIFGLLINKEYFNNVYNKKSKKLAIKIIFLFSLVILILVNSIIAWACLLLGVLFILVINKIIKREETKKEEEKSFKKKIKKIFWPSLFVLFLLIYFASSFFNSNTEEYNFKFYKKLQLDYSNSLSVAKKTVLRPFGAGQETFSYVFSKNRDVSLNAGAYWYLRFNQSASYIAEKLTSIGVIGIIIYIIFVDSLLLIAIKQIFREKDILLTTVTGVTISLFLAQFFYPANMTLLFLFWLFIAISIVLINKNRESNNNIIIINKEVSIKKYRVVIIVLFIFLSSLLAVAGLEIKYWFANSHYLKGVKAKNINEKENEVLRALKLNPHRSNYWTTLAKVYLEKSEQATLKSADMRDLNDIKIMFNKSIDSAREATKVNPASVVAFETLGMIYRSMSAYSNDVGPMAVEAFKKASELEPTNPVLATELAKAYVNSNQGDEAIIAFKKALELKKDYFDANFSLARVYIEQEENKLAIDILTSIKDKTAEVYYELGKAYFNEDDFEMAIENFNKTVNLSPRHANALYSLGLALEKIDRLDEALVYFKKAAKLSLDNEELNKKISELEDIN